MTSLLDPKMDDIIREALRNADRKNALTTVAAVTGIAGGVEELQAYVELARNHPKVRDGELEIDANAVVSPGGDGGAYVMAWLWVNDPEEGDDD